MMKKVILHCDLNNFYASVECRKHPELKRQCVAVSGDVDNRHGIILAKNEHAKKYGIQTGETIWQAKQKCPQLVLIPPHFHEYLAISKQVKAVYHEYSDRVESFGLDEAWIDCTQSVHLFGSGVEIANALRKRMKAEFALTISVGVSFNKIYAKLGSDYQKPDATTYFSEENYQDKVFPLPVEMLLYVGKATQRKLAMMGIVKIGELACANRDLLVLRLGKMGALLQDFANGIDHSEVLLFDRSDKLKSIGNGITPKKDMLTLDMAVLVLYVLCDSIATRLRRAHKLGKCVRVMFRSATLLSFSRQASLADASNLCEEIVAVAIAITKKHYSFHIALRSISVCVTQLVDEQSYHQLALFTQHDKIETIERCMDQIREKFGNDAIFRANLLLDIELTAFSPLDDHVIFPQGYFK